MDDVTAQRRRQIRDAKNVSRADIERQYATPYDNCSDDEEYARYWESHVDDWIRDDRNSDRLLSLIGDDAVAKRSLQRLLTVTDSHVAETLRKRLGQRCADLAYNDICELKDFEDQCSAENRAMMRRNGGVA